MTDGTEPTSAGPRHSTFQWAESAPAVWVVAVLLRGRRVVSVCAGLGFLIAMAVALLKPASYTSSFSLIPQAAQNPARSGLASLAGQFGIQVGGALGGEQPPALYAELVRTRELLSGVASKRFQLKPDDREGTPLARFLEVEGSDSAVVRERTVRVLREKVVAASVAARTTGAVTVTVRTSSPQVSLGIAQSLLDALNRFNIETRQSQAGQERQFIERRLAEAQAALRRAEDALQRFLQANRQFSSSPQLSFQNDRLERDVTLQQQVVNGLAQQYEEARIREVRDTPVFTVIEEPALPVLPDPRGRAITVILGTMVGFLIGIGAVLARAGWQRQRSSGLHEPAYAMLEREWQRMRGRSVSA
jgi:uncharacterized protein involved in exopolysaccharide biosynthesis